LTLRRPRSTLFPYTTLFRSDPDEDTCVEHVRDTREPEDAEVRGEVVRDRGAGLREKRDFLVVHPDRVRAEEPWPERAETREVTDRRRAARRPGVLVLGGDLGDVHLQRRPEPPRTLDARLDERVRAVEDRPERIGETQPPVRSAVPARGEVVLDCERLLGGLAARLGNSLGLVHRASAEEAADSGPRQPP